MDYKIKRAGAVLDFKFDWKALTNGSGVSDWLEAGETISSHTVTVSNGITKDSDSITDSNTTVTVWLSGGTSGKTETVTCEIVTNLGRTDQRTMRIKVIPR